MKPLCVELFCGCFGWSAGWLELGGYVVGFDIEHLPHHGPVPDGADLVIQDVLTLHGSQFRDASLILASPPCQFFSYCAMPWSRAKTLEAEVWSDAERKAQATALFDACFRIQREACEAAGHHIPMVVENVRGAQKWVGRSRWNHGSFHLWGDVPALMPITKRLYDGLKLAGNNGPRLWSEREAQRLCDAGRKGEGSWFGDYQTMKEGTKQGGDWFNQSQPSISRMCSSKSTARKAASAMIAKIPLALSSYIGRVYYQRAP